MPYTPRRTGVRACNRIAVEKLEDRTLFAISTLPVLIGGAAAKSVQFTDPNGTRAVVQLSGAGNATVNFTGDNLSQAASANGIAVSGTNISLDSINVTGTTLNSVLRVSTVGRSQVSIGGITTSTVLASILAPGAVLTGDMSTGGWVHQVSLGGAQDGTITIGPSHINGGLMLNVGSAVDENLVSDIRVDSLNAGQWVDFATAGHSIQAPQVMHLNVRGNFAPDLLISGVAGARSALGTFAAGGIVGGTWTIGGSAQTIRAGSAGGGWTATAGGSVGTLNITGNATLDLTAPTMGTMLVRGALTDSNITLTQPLAPVGFDLTNLSVGGGIVSSTIRSSGSINAINAARIQDSQIYAGIVALPAGQGLPQTTGDFANVAQINSITLRRTAAVASFSGSDIAAYGIGSVVLGTVDTNNSGTPFGLGTHRLRSISLTQFGTNKAVHVNNVPSTVFFSSVLIAKGINPGDLTVNII